ncbi:capsular exopolysaccharide family [Epibacterium ulvae]|uniref:non-specific protein-tyrosine kinase n=1 Tax=Epibacterium ulvae TaxID=1156985 RepID=A0A1G5RFC2_9RHOB|nr:polysaccharide biosynthesis tyrosine autokinase [Epibacterium ulvae]SCZ71979.1 capsular exopolysaccharide family [Epibacterium ulvae]
MTKAASNISNHVDDSGRGLRMLFGMLWRGRMIIGICVALGAVFGVMSASQIEPRYRAHGKVMFDVQQANVLNMEDMLLASPLFDSSALENQIQILSSTALIERVIDELELDKDPEFNPLLRVEKPSALDKVRDLVDVGATLDALRQRLSGAVPAQDEQQNTTARDRSHLVRLAVISNVRKGLSFRPVGRSRVIQIAFMSDNRATAAKIVNTVAEKYILDQQETKQEAARAATVWLAERVDELRLSVQTAEEAIETARSEISDRTGQTLEVTQQQLEALNLEFAATQAALSRQEVLYNRLTDFLAQSTDFGTVSEFRDSPLIQQYRIQLEDLLSEQSILRASYPEGHPSLQQVSEDITTVQTSMAQEAQRIATSAGLDLQGIRAQEASLLAEVRRLEKLALEQTRSEVDLRQLSREAEASRVLYESFLARLQATAAQEDLHEADARILTRAEIPLFPQSQSKSLVLTMFSMIGAIIGVGIVFIRTLVNTTFRSLGQLELVTGQHLLGVLPFVGRYKTRVRVFQYLLNKPNSVLAEAIRNLRTSILMSNVDHPPKVLMFTSSVPGEGKTTTAVMTALTSQQMGKSTIIVDCDMRRPDLSQFFTSPHGNNGLIAALHDDAPLEEAVFQDPETGLHVLMTETGGRSARVNAADVLSSQKFNDLIERLTETYDLVILDTPPTLAVTDARIISKRVDSVIYAVRWGSTARGAVVEGLKELESVGAPISGVLMTMMDVKKSGRFSYNETGYYRSTFKNSYVKP